MPSLALLTEGPAVVRSSRLGVSAGLWSALDPGEARPTVSGGGLGRRVNGLAREREGKQAQSRAPSTRSIDSRRHQKVWSRLRVGLLTSSDPVKKQCSQLCQLFGCYWILYVDKLTS